MIKIYKDVLLENERLKILSMIKNFPDSPEIWTQSVCTDEGVIQLREYMPFYIMQRLHKIHEKMLPVIEEDFNLKEKGIKLDPPKYCNPSGTSLISVDKRIKGMSLGAHADIPTGTFTKHIGSASGESPITMSSVYYWNDDFDGGLVNFHENAIPGHILALNPELKEKNNDHSITQTYKPVAGDFIVFPSETVHSITEITSGVRLSTQYFYFSNKLLVGKKV